jgi:hypothetical protein
MSGVKVAAQTIYQALIDAEETAVIGAGPWEHSPERTGLRNGYRSRVFSTAAGDLETVHPEAAQWLGFPSLLARRRRVDQALFAVVMEAYLHGVSTRKVDDLVQALGIDAGISKSELSRIWADLDLEVGSGLPSQPASSPSFATGEAPERVLVFAYLANRDDTTSAGCDDLLQRSTHSREVPNGSSGDLQPAHSGAR